MSRSTTLAAELAALAREARQLLEPADYLAALEWLDEEARRP